MEHLAIYADAGARMISVLTEGRKFGGSLGNAPTTASMRFEYGDRTGVDPTRPGVALPELVPVATAPGTGARLDGAATPPVAAGRLDTPGAGRSR